jgi:hypothetical protein
LLFISLWIVAGVGSGCSSSSVRLSRDWDEPAEEEAAYEVQSPEAFVERLGEPDSWKNEGEDEDLRMTAVWKCVDGQTREVVWRQQDSGRGLRRWVVVSDTSREGCEE